MAFYEAIMLNRPAKTKKAPEGGEKPSGGCHGFLRDEPLHG